MHIVDRFMDKLMPKKAQETHSRQDETDRVVVDAERARKSAEQSMIEAYRKAGVQFATPKRRWDD